MARLSGWVAALLALVTLQASAQPSSYDDAVIQSISYGASTRSVRPGGKFRLAGRFKITSFGNADRVYCAFKNLDWAAAHTSWGTPEDSSRPPLKVDDYYRSKYIKSTLTFEKVYWEFYKATSASIVNKEWTVTARGVRVDPTTTATSMKWRWYCEAYWDDPANPAVPFNKTYPIGKDKEFTIAIAGTPITAKSASAGGPKVRTKAIKKKNNK